MQRNVFTSDFKDIIFNFFDYAFIYNLYDCFDVISIRVQVDYMVSRGVRPYLRVRLNMFVENMDTIKKATETDIPVTNYSQMAHNEKPLVCFLSVQKLLQQRSKFKIDSRPNKPMEIKMNQGVTRRIQASTNPEGNVHFKKPDNIRVVNTVEVKEDSQTIRMNKGERQVAIVDSKSGKQMVFSFDLLEAFYHAAQS